MNIPHSKNNFEEPPFNSTLYIPLGKHYTCTLLRSGESFNK